MDQEPNIDLWLQNSLKHWAEQGTLSADQSLQIQMKITALAEKERKTHISNKIISILTAIITMLYTLFASCPVAAASYSSSPIAASHSMQILVFCMLFINLAGFLYKNVQPVKIILFEVNYE